MTRLLLTGFPVAVMTAGILLCGCTPSIGDACESNSDCDTSHTCDQSQPGGYCTVSPCPREGCPSGSVCVRFGHLDTWCMQACGIYDYCRDGYECVNDFVDPIDPEAVTPPFCNQSAGNTADATP